MEEKNINGRLEAFCDGVFAFALTILILDVKVVLPENIHTEEELWQSLKDLLPHFSAFLLSFAIIAITWYNHHATMKLINKTTPHFIYANFFLLLNIVIIPFPTGLFSEFGFTEAAAPAVVLYSFVILLCNIGWILITQSALKPQTLAKNDAAKKTIEAIAKQSWSAFFLYSICTILAFWFPLAIFVVLSLTWIVWLILGINYKESKTNLPTEVSE